MSEVALSDCWREIRSADPGCELAHLLTAARTMAQTLLPGVDVAFSGMDVAHTDRKVIYTTARDFDQFPVPGITVDKFLGWVVHEAGHCLFSPDKPSLIRDVFVYREEDMPDLVNVVEDIYINHLLSAFPVYREYLMSAISQALTEDKIKGVFQPLRGEALRLEMINALMVAGIMGKLPPDITPDNLSMLGKLLESVSRLCTGKTTRGLCLKRCWDIVKDMPTRRQPPPPPPPPPSPEKSDGELPTPTKGDDSDDKESKDESKSEPDSGQHDDQDDGEESEEKSDEEDSGTGQGEDAEAGNAEGDMEKSEEEDGDDAKVEPPLPEKAESLASLVNDDIANKKRLSADVANAVSDAIVEKRADLTQMVSVLAGHAHHTIITYTPKSSGEETEARKHTQEAENLLRRIFQDYRLRRTEYYRGLYSGKVSNRRLHRVGYGDPRVFQRRDRPEEIDLAVALIMDCSGSMSPHTALVFQIITAMSDALSKEKVPFIAIGYSSSGLTVDIARFSDSEGGLHLGYKGGWTPSYEGIAAGIAQLLRFAGNRRKVLFHYTDGGANSSTSPYIPELLKKARGMGIEDYHLGPPRHVEALYERIVEVDDIAKLPSVVEELLRKEMEK